MRKELLNQRPTSALRGLSPLCESVGAGHTSTHPSIFTKVLLVLLTTLLLPSATWGETKTYTYNFSQTSIQQRDVDEINNTVYGWKYVEPYNYTPIVDWDAVYFTTGLTSFTSPINFPASITSVTIKADARYATEVTINGTKKNLSANSALRFDASTNYYTGMSPQTLEFTSITLDSPGPLKIEFSDTDEGLLAIESITIVYEPETYPITIAGIAVTNENASNITGSDITGKVSFTPASGTNPAVLTLNGATIEPEAEENGIWYTGTANLTISLMGNNTVKGSGGCGAIGYSNNGATAPTLTFTNGGTEACSLQLEAENTQTIGGFANVINTGLYKIDETILGADQSNTYKTIITTLGGGSGTSSDPIIIKTAEDLRDFAKLVNRGTITNEYIKLNPEGGELDCNGLTGFEPIGILINSSYNYPFIGKFDGNNCTIKNLTYSTNGTGDRVGLFGYVGNEDVSDTKIEKLTLSNCSFNGGEYVGGIVGELKNGTIENCVLSSCTVKSGNAQIPYTGGIAGWVDNGTINTCTFNSGLVDCTTAYSGEPSGGVYAGGIVGYIYSTNSVTVSLCTVSSTNVKSVHSGSDGAYDIYVGGIVGCSLGTVAISDNKVTNTYNTDNPKKISCQSGVDYTVYHCGAIIGEKGDATTLSNNIYEYDVITEIAGTPKSGYTQRGIGGTTYNEQTEKYEENPDVTEDNGAVMYTKALTVGVSNECDDYYEPLTDYEDGILAFAPGQTVDIEVFPADGVTISSASLVYTPTGGTEQTVPLENKSETAGEYNYVFEMPDADATLNATIVQTYDLWIGETQVTSTNADHILGEGNTTVTFTAADPQQANSVNTLTLKGAALTVPVKVGLDRLTVDVQGTNSITVPEGNVFKLENDETNLTSNVTCYITFKTSTADGNLTLTSTSQETIERGGVFYYHSYNDYKAKFDITIAKSIGLIQPTNSYYLTNGSSEYHVVRFAPSLGVSLGDGYGGTKVITDDNAADVFEGDETNGGKVSFNKSTNTLTLNGASLSAPLSTSLATLTVDLLGENTLRNYYDGHVIETPYGDDVTITFKSSADVKGMLTMTMNYSSDGNMASEHVTLKYTAPLSVVSGSMTGNQGNDKKVVIGESYGLTVAGVTVSNVNASAVTGTYIQKKTDDGFVSYDAESNTLTLNNVNLSTTASAPIIVSSLDALKVNIVGNVEFEFQDVTPSYVFGSTNPNGVLTFTTTDDGKPQIYIDNGSNNGAFTGFKTVNYEKGLALRTQQIDYTDYWIEPMVAPAFGAFSLNAETGKLTGTITSYAYEGATIKYSIDYADDHENVSNAVYSTSVVMEGPGTVTAYIAVGESTSPVTTAKWFAFASHEVQGVKGQESVAVPAVIPTIETSDDITVTYSSDNATIASVSEGNITFNGVGATTISGLYEIGDEVPFIILNDGDIFDEIAVTVVPPAPVIAYDGTKTYLSTDKIEISLDPTYAAAPSGSNTIYYSWAENPTTGTEYPEGGVEAQTGTQTLTAWVVATVSDVNYPSAKATQEFTVKKDIASCTVTLPESAIYTGDAFEPVVEESEIKLKLGTDYTVSYQKVVGETATEVESMIDAGTYKITITGAGDFGGTKEISNFLIGQASLEDATICTLIVGDKEYEYDSEDIEIPYTGETIQPNVIVKYNNGKVTVDASEYTISYGENNTDVSAEASASVIVTSTGKNFEEGTSTSLNFKIVPATITITAGQQAVTYNANEQEYDISKVVVSNDKAKLAVTYYTTEGDRNKGENALTGAPTDAGTYYVKVTLNEESLQHYVAEPSKTTFTIEQLNISLADITLDNTVLTYNGEQQTVNVTKVMAGDIEVPIDCYEVSGNTEKEAGDYKLTVTAKTKDSQGNAIKNNFTGSAEKDWKIKNRTVTANELGLSENQPQATYYSDTENLEVPDGVVANIITSVSDGKATTQRISYIPKNVPVFVELTTSSEEPIEIPEDPSELPLKGTAEPKDVADISGGTVFVLYKGEFVKSITGTIPAHRCYLLLSNDVAAGTRAFGIIRGVGGSNGSTAIKSIEIDNTPSTIENWYDMRGRRIEKPTKTGIYIKNGKIVVINNK